MAASLPTAAQGHLDNKTEFPPWDDLPATHPSSPVYHVQGASNRPGTGHRFVPKRHWCFLSDIIECDGFGRYRTHVQDGNYDEVYVAFYFDNYDDFDFRALKEGHTLAIMYAHQHYFMDGTSGVRVENPEHVKVFPMSLLDLQVLGSEHAQYSKISNGKATCHACDRTAQESDLNRCGGCRQFFYCNKDCQTEGWRDKEHKLQCKVLKDPCFQDLVNLDFSTYEAPFSFKTAAARAVPPSRPATRPSRPVASSVANTVQTEPSRPGVPPSNPTSVLAIALNRPSYFDNIHGRLMEMIASKVTLETAKDSQSALRALATRPSAVLLTDEALTKYKNRAVWDAVLEYVRAGGTAVAMAQFSSNVKPLEVEPFFAKAGLRWASSSYHRTTVALNPAVGEEIKRHLPSQYSQKAVSLKNVDSAVVWYAPNEDSRIESFVFAPERIENLKEAPVVFAQVGQGNIGYVGDVNGEQGSDEVVMAMCGLKG